MKRWLFLVLLFGRSSPAAWVDCRALISQLLAVADPMQVEESEMRLAVDLTIRDLRPGESMEIQSPDEASKRGLLILFNAHEKIHAVAIGDVIKVRKLR